MSVARPDFKLRAISEPSGFASCRFEAEASFWGVSPAAVSAAWLRKRPGSQAAPGLLPAQAALLLRSLQPGSCPAFSRVSATAGCPVAATSPAGAASSCIAFCRQLAQPERSRLSCAGRREPTLLCEAAASDADDSATNSFAIVVVPDARFKDWCQLDRRGFLHGRRRIGRGDCTVLCNRCAAKNLRRDRRCRTHPRSSVRRGCRQRSNRRRVAGSSVAIGDSASLWFHFNSDLSPLQVSGRLNQQTGKKGSSRSCLRQWRWILHFQSSWHHFRFGRQLGQC